MVARRSAQLLCPEAWQRHWHNSETVGPLDDGSVSRESRVVLIISYSPQEAEWTGAVGPCQLDNLSAVPWWLLRATLIVALTNVYYRSRDRLAPLPQPSAVLFAQHHCLLLNLSGSRLLDSVPTADRLHRCSRARSTCRHRSPRCPSSTLGDHLGALEKDS
jgi:hypothetical protein